MATQETSDEITRLYAATFNRPPDATGLAYWDAAVDDGSTVPQIANFFAHSPEFITDYGALTDSAFVTQLYANVLGRAPDAPGAAYWINDLAVGDTRGSVLNFFAQSPENIAHTAAVAMPMAPAPAVVTPTPTPAPPAVPDPTITGVETINTPGAFVFDKATPSDTATLITTAANAEASTFTFEGFGGQVDLSDLTFDGFNFISNYTGGFPPATGGLSQESIAFPYGGKFVLTEQGAPVATLNVVSLTPASSSSYGTDPNNGFAFIHVG